ELAEERLLPVLGVVLVGERPVNVDELRGTHGEASSLEAAEDLAGQTALHGVRLDQNQSSLQGHGAETLLGAATPSSARSPRRRQWCLRRWDDRTLPGLGQLDRRAAHDRRLA